MLTGRSCAQSVGVDMADRHRQGVGGVGLGDLGQSQQGLEHLLHLPLLGPPLPHHGLFDLQRGIFGHRQTGIDSRHNGRAAGLPQLEGTLHIGGKKDILDSRLVGADTRL